MKHAMKLAQARLRRRREAGYATMVAVASVSMLLIGMMVYALVGNLSSFDAQIAAQVKQDYAQKEDAILSSLLHIVPNKAIGAMQRGSASTPQNFTWEKIFEEALSSANAEQAASPAVLAALNLEGAISANTGDTVFQSSTELVSAPVMTYAGGASIVNGGNWWEFYMLQSPKVGPYVPAPLEVSYAHYLLDKAYPLITHEKRYVHWYSKGLNVPAATYRQFNLIQYPDVRFGYRRAGELFVAKRNWWTFSLTFGASDQEKTGIPPSTKTYVLSIYEIPSQLPLSASALMRVGRFADGSDWENVSLDGGIFAERLVTEGDVAISGGGSLSARRSIELSGGTTVDGQSLQSGFDNLGAREERALDSDSDFYAASLAGNVGKVAFIPLNPGNNFLNTATDGELSERISPTGWNDYTRGANQAVMRVHIRTMQSASVQRPTEISFRYLRANNTYRTVVYTRGSNWPTDNQPGGEEFPFQTDQLENGRHALVVNLDRIPDYLVSLGDAAGLDRNHSLWVHPRSSHGTVNNPSIPSAPSDMVVSLRGGKDLTAFTEGLSLVSRYRVYIAETLNTETTDAPPNSGIPVGEPFHPPLSLFAPEKRFGESLLIEHPVSVSGQLSTLNNNVNSTYNPMELKNASEERVESDLIRAELRSIRSPAQLPPINMMNWMVTIEEIH